MILDLVRDLGAVPDGRDARPQLEAGLAQLKAAGGGTIHAPAGRFGMSRVPLRAWGVRIPSYITIEGEGNATQFAALDAQNSFFYMFWPEDNSGSIQIKNLLLDGNRMGQSIQGDAAGHQTGLFISTTSEVVIQNVSSKEWWGDGIQLFTGAESILIDNFRATNCIRGGVTFTGAISNVILQNSTVHGTRGNAIDFEPSNAGKNLRNIRILRNNVYAGGGDFAITLTGAEESSDIWVTDNYVEGALLCLSCRGVRIRGNTFKAPGSMPFTAGGMLQFQRNVSDLEIVGNTVDNSTDATNALLSFAPENTTQKQTHIIVTDNNFRYHNAAGAQIWSVQDLLFERNKVTAMAPGLDIPVKLRTTGQPLEDVRILNNDITAPDGCTSAINLLGSVSVPTRAIEIDRNIVRGKPINGVMIQGAANSGYLIERLTIGATDCRDPAVKEVYCKRPWTSQRRDGSTAWACYGSPDGVLVAPVGDTCTQVDVSTMGPVRWKKISGQTTSTGWTVVP